MGKFRKTHPLKNLKAIILLFVANTVSGIAQGISMIAVPWYYTQLGESQFFGSFYVFLTLFLAFWVIYAGTLVDRFNRKHLFLGLNAIIGTIIASIALYGYVKGDLPLYLPILVFGLTFVNYTVHYPALYAFAQEISLPEHFGKITSYIEIQGQLTTMIAGALGAFLLEGGMGENGIISLDLSITPWRIHDIFALDAFTYLLSFILIALIHYNAIAKRKQETGSSLERIRVGMRYLKSHPQISIFGLASYSLFATILIANFYLLAPYVKNFLGRDVTVFAFAEIFYAAGALFAGFFIRKLFASKSKIFAVITLILISSTCYLLFTFNHSIFVFYAVCLIIGCCNAGTRIMRVTYLLNMIPNQVIGRTNSVFAMVNALFRFGFLLLFALPFFHKGGNIVFSFLIFSVFVALAGILLITKYKSFPLPKNASSN